MQRKVNYFKKRLARFQSKGNDKNFELNKKRKIELFSGIEGTVLEIGPGIGTNFVFLNKKEIRWIGVEPNPAMHPYLLESAKKQGVSASLLDCYSEAICLPDSQVDFVICTKVLCSVSNLDRSMNEIKRVLKPGGKFLFLEHVVDNHNFLRRAVQKIVPYTPWKYYSDGCEPGRDIAASIKNTGFTSVSFIQYMQEGKGLIHAIKKPHIYGSAIK